MSFNNGNERRKLNAKWEHLRVQYREAGMSEDAIQAMYEFDLGVLNSERAYITNTLTVSDTTDDSRIECNEYGGDYVKTLFGVKWQTHYMGDAFWAGCEVRDRISEEFKRRMDAAQYSVRLFFSDFAICASKEVNHQADMICQKIEGHR